PAPSKSPPDVLHLYTFIPRTIPPAKHPKRRLFAQLIPKKVAYRQTFYTGYSLSFDSLRNGNGLATSSPCSRRRFTICTAEKIASRNDSWEAKFFPAMS